MVTSVWLIQMAYAHGISSSNSGCLELLVGWLSKWLSNVGEKFSLVGLPILVSNIHDVLTLLDHLSDKYYHESNRKGAKPYGNNEEGLPFSL